MANHNKNTFTISQCVMDVYMSCESRQWTQSFELVNALAASLATSGTESRKRPFEGALCARIQKHKTADAQHSVRKTPIMRMRECRDALSYLDSTGWNRSFHQRLFHEDFLKACTRTFWKMEPLGSFARAHQQVLQENSWEHLAQEVLISTPRRFGKTISVSMFAAAMLYAAPAVELSIYSTCKRISQKLLRGVVKFFYEICEQNIGKHNFRIRRQNMEEIVLVGPEGERDVRIVNSYPSKVRAVSCARPARAPHAPRTPAPADGRICGFDSCRGLPRAHTRPRTREDARAHTHGTHSLLVALFFNQTQKTSASPGATKRWAYKSHLASRKASLSANTISRSCPLAILPCSVNTSASSRLQSLCS